jgi:hypothetical protein
MGVLKNSRREKFAQAVAKGKSQVDAYRVAGFVPNDGHAARMAAKPDVRERILELKERAAEKAECTVADIARQLDEDREFARELQNPSAAISATLGKAKVLGLIIDKAETSGPNGGPIVNRIELVDGPMPHGDYTGPTPA